jgi:hypothetical protein
MRENLKSQNSEWEFQQKQLSAQQKYETVLTVLFGKLLRFSILCSSLRATTHFVFSLSVSANISVWFFNPGGSISEVVICDKNHSTLAYKTLQIKTYPTQTQMQKKKFKQTVLWFCSNIFVCPTRCVKRLSHEW